MTDIKGQFITSLGAILKSCIASLAFLGSFHSLASLTS